MNDMERELYILTVSLLRDSDGKNTATYHMLFRIIDCVHSDTSSFFMLILHYFRFFVRKKKRGKNALSKYPKLFIERMRKIWYELQTDVSMNWLQKMWNVSW